MSSYAPWLILVAVIFVAGLGYLLITASNELDTALKDAFDKQDAKEKP